MRRELLAPLLLATLLLGQSLYVSLDVLEAIPHSQDEVAYLFQAQIFARGRVYLPSLPEPVRQFFDHEFIINDGKWYGKYTPGNSLFLAFGILAGAPWLVNPLFGFLSVWLLYLIARRVYGQRPAVWACALFAVSPFAVLMSASFLSHAPALLFTLLFFLALLTLASREAGSRGYWSIVAGVSAGMVFLTRPYNSFILLALFAAFLFKQTFAWFCRGDRHVLREAFLFAVPFGILAVLNMGYNGATTGNYLKFPHQSYSATDTIGFGWRGVEWGATFTLEDAQENFEENLEALKKVLVSWPKFELLALSAFAILTRKRITSLFLVVAAAVHVGAYFIYFHSGVFYGPRYWYEVAWVPLLLSGVGMGKLLSLVERFLSRRLVDVILIGSVTAGLYFSVKGNLDMFEAYRSYNRMTRLSLPALERPALVLIPNSETKWQVYGRYFIMQTPFLQEEDVIFARDSARHNVWKGRPPVSNLVLSDYFSERRVYRITADGEAVVEWQAGE